MHQPLKAGGVGIRSTANTPPVAFLSAVMTYADALAPVLLRVPQADQEQLPTFQELRRAITHINNPGGLGKTER